jgi:hypothetical protein
MILFIAFSFFQLREKTVIIIFSSSSSLTVFSNPPSWASSDPPHQHQDDHNQKNQSKSTAGIVSPAFTVSPGGQCADENENQNNDQYRTHVFPPFLLFEPILS